MTERMADTLNYTGLPKLDLHIHLDGSLHADTVIELARLNGVALPVDNAEHLAELISVPPDCDSLTDFLAVFEVFYPVLMFPGALATVADRLCRDLLADKTVYAEPRLAPALLLPARLESYNDKLDYIITEMQKVSAVFDQYRTDNEDDFFQAALILCIMRGSDAEAARLTVDAALELNRNSPGSIAALDVAGDESRFKAAVYADELKRAAGKLGLTVHAGEAAGPASIIEALDMGADRIGHGVRCVEDDALYQRLLIDRVPLEVCLTSNRQTGTVPPGRPHPLGRFLADGLCATLNTDDPGVSNLSLSSEWQHAASEFGFDRQAVQQLSHNAIEAAFCTETLRSRLKARLNHWLSHSE